MSQSFLPSFPSCYPSFIEYVRTLENGDQLGLATLLARLRSAYKLAEASIVEAPAHLDDMDRLEFMWDQQAHADLQVLHNWIQFVIDAWLRTGRTIGKGVDPRPVPQTDWLIEL